MLGVFFFFLKFFCLLFPLVKGAYVGSFFFFFFKFFCLLFPLVKGAYVGSFFFFKVFLSSISLSKRGLCWEFFFFLSFFVFYFT